MEQMQFADLVGKRIISVDGAVKGSEEVIIKTDVGTFSLSHNQDCCEVVDVAEVVGDVADLQDAVCVEAEESVNPEGTEPVGESSTWTFYKLGTTKGFVTIRWLGQSNGYYSEAVDFRQLRD